MVEQSDVSGLRGLRVCMVAPYLPKRGGVTIQAHLMVDGLESAGARVFRVDTILHKLDRSWLKPLRVLLQPLFVAVRFLRTAPKCDVVHVHACSWWGFVPVLVCAPINRLFFRKRFIISYHGGLGHVFLARWAWLVVPFLKMADRIVVVSARLKNVFSEYGIESEVLRNLVDLQRFRFRKRERLQPNIVWIRRFEDVYDPMTALRVFEKVKAGILEATITFIGDGELRADMEKYIEQRGLTGVRFTGRLPNENVPDEFDKADVFLNTSRNDGLPTALLEASASGLPIVTTDAGGIPDMIENGKDGIIVPVGDVDALAREVISLLEDPERAAAIGESARRNAEKYGWDQCAKQLAKLYGRSK
ncbi:MAG: glycosyltransferase family 4 protein [Armatimonadetes bacterium]|nr:glycosyltransferase family 4 protein [Armatimonadota bacterium]